MPMGTMITYQRQADSTRRYDRKLGQILRVAARLMAKQGYEKTSVRQVAKQAGVVLSGLYYYMTGKEELLFLIQFHTFDSLVRTLKERLAACESPEAALRAVIRTHLDHFLAHMDELKVCARELEALSGEFYQKVLSLRREYFALALSVVEELATQNGSDMDPQIATLSLFGALNWMYQWYNPRKGVSADRLEEELTRLFVGALGSGGAAGSAAGEKETRG